MLSWFSRTASKHSMLSTPTLRGASMTSSFPSVRTFEPASPGGRTQTRRPQVKREGRPLIRLGLLRPCLLLMAMHCCYAAISETKDVPSAAKRLLEPDLHFALIIPDYRPNLLVHTEDLFSEWGDLVLTYTGPDPPALAVVRSRLLSAARKNGWEQANSDENVTPTQNLSRYGIAAEKADFELAKRAGADEPPFAHSKIWITPDGARILVVYRLDSN